MSKNNLYPMTGWHSALLGRSISVRHAEGTVCRISITADSKHAAAGHAYARLISAAPDLLAALGAVEWAPTDTEGGPYACPACGEYQNAEGQHREDCALAAALTKAADGNV